MSDSKVQIEITSQFDGKGAQQAVAATKQLQDESARYQATLKRMADTDGEANRTERLAALRARLQAYKAQKGELTDLTGLTKTYSRAEVDALTASQAATEKATVSKGNLKAMVRGLAFEFPILRNIASATLNPITLAVAGVVAGFSIFRSRVEAATRALAQTELPDLTKLDPEKLGAAAKAWEGIAASVSKAVESYNSLPAASERALKAIAAETEARQKALATNRATELARLEAGKDQLSPETYARARVDIEDRYRQTGVSDLDREQWKKSWVKQQELFNTITGADKNAKKARRIKIAGKEFDADSLKNMEGIAAASQEDVARAQANKERLEGMRESVGWNLLNPLQLGRTLKKGASDAWWLYRQGGFRDVRRGLTQGGISEMIAEEGENEATAKARIASAAAFRARMPARDQLRSERDTAAQAAGEGFGRGFILDQGLRAGDADYQAVMATARAVARAELIQDLLQTLQQVRGISLPAEGDLKLILQRLAQVEARTANLR